MIKNIDTHKKNFIASWKKKLRVTMKVLLILKKLLILAIFMDFMFCVTIRVFIARKLGLKWVEEGNRARK